jgi:predicted nucleotidyltransferase
LEITDLSIGALLARLVDSHQEALGINLIGSYVFGSVVTGDFESGISDVDIVAVIRSNLKAAELAALAQLHLDIVEEMPEWEDRVEVAYLSSWALKTFRTESSAAARISPGEPFHEIEVDSSWLIDWYQLREAGIALLGPPATSLVPAISSDEYVEAVRQHVLDWPDLVDEPLTRGDQAYAILTMCRGLRTSRTAQHVSKREAARWAGEALPEHARLIQDALAWRERSGNGSAVDGAATLEATRAFVSDVKRLVAHDYSSTD